MIIPDINLLIYAHNDQAPQHQKAKAWWEGLLNGKMPLGLPWISNSGFIRLMTKANSIVPLPILDALQACTRSIRSPDNDQAESKKARNFKEEPNLAVSGVLSTASNCCFGTTSGRFCNFLR